MPYMIAYLEGTVAHVVKEYPRNERPIAYCGATISASMAPVRVGGQPEEKLPYTVSYCQKCKDAIMPKK